MMPRLSLGGTFLAGEGTTRWPTLFFSRSLKCDKDSLNLVMTRPTMNSLVFVHPDTREVVALPSLFFLVTHLQLLACCYKCHLSSLKYNDFRYHEAIIHIRCWVTMCYSTLWDLKKWSLFCLCALFDLFTLWRIRANWGGLGRTEED